MSAAFTLVDRLPTVAEFQQLRESAGWTRVADDAVARALHQTLFAVCLEQDGQLVGSGRIVGDGAIYFYIQDVIVLLPFRGTGGGKLIMSALMEYLDRQVTGYAFVGLMAAKGVASYYEQFGFRPRPTDGPGMFLTLPRE
ncbi:MAG: GNAT family N-acetyltransferase [Saprospiraceae bacterium]|nr:GNAT family N-acetyltransferase [Saprospiraceae bacterium]MCB0622356.1 GNAT family N-acetyltransferase [Saprospiraceae bacterium]MCB0682870.1 GNAT family N-acetyltransferase [Saprospiraceae bacterium]